MADDNQQRSSVDDFIIDRIETVPHLEALLQLWNTRPKLWSAPEIGKTLYISTAAAKDILNDLVRHRLIATGNDTFSYRSDAELDLILAEVDLTYRRELVRVSNLIHSKPSAAVREFARAFRFKKERE